MLNREPLLKAASDRATIDRFRERDRRYCLIDAVNDKPSDAMIDDLRNGTSSKGDHRGPVGHRFDEHQAERFGPIDRKGQRYRVAQESLLVAVADLTDELDQRIFEQRLDPGPVINTISLVDLRRDGQRQTRTAGDLNRPIRSLLRTDSANKGEIAAITGARSRIGSSAARGKQCRTSLPKAWARAARLRSTPVASLRTRGERAEDPADRGAMHRRQCLPPALCEQREVEVVSVEMDYVEGICAARHAIERYIMIDEWILALGTETQRPVAGCPQDRISLRIAAGEQSDFVPLTNKLFGEM